MASFGQQRAIHPVTLNDGSKVDVMLIQPEGLGLRWSLMNLYHGAAPQPALPQQARWASLAMCLAPEQRQAWKVPTLQGCSFSLGALGLSASDALLAAGWDYQDLETISSYALVLVGSGLSSRQTAVVEAEAEGNDSATGQEAPSTA
jgi:hypothetical protein